MDGGFKVTLTARQLTGAALLALLALFVSGSLYYNREHRPAAAAIPFGDQDRGSIAVEVEGTAEKGIYFLPAGKTLNDLLYLLHLTPIRNDPANPGGGISLRNGLKIEVLQNEKKQTSFRVGGMAASTRLALNLPIDVNLASREELVLVPGIGEKTAGKIIEARAQRGTFSRLEELMAVKGIKEKRLEKLRPYLYVENRPKTVADGRDEP